MGERIAAIGACVLLAMGCGADPLVEGTDLSQGGTTASAENGGSTGAETSSGADSSTSAAASSSSSGEPVDTSGSSSSDDPGSSSSEGSSGSAADVAVETEMFSAGFDTRDISPTADELALNIHMGAYGPPFVRGPAEGVHDSIFIRSMAVELGEDGFVAAVADLPGMANNFTYEVRVRVAAALDLPPGRVLIGTTHTHSAPDFQGLWGGGPDEYRDRVIDDIVDSMEAAWEARESATLEVASTIGPNRNRRDWGFTDDSLITLVARNEREDVLGTLGVFAAHPTVVGQDNKLITRDWCGAFVDTMEAETQAPALLFMGILGDVATQVPAGDYADDFEEADAYGSLLADIAIESLAETEAIDPELYVDHRTWTLAANNALFQLAATIGILDYEFEGSGANQTVDTIASYIRLGTQLQLVTFPGESLTRNGLDIKDSMVAPHRILLGQTGDAFGYFIPSDEWMTGRNGDYEETVALHPTAGDITRDVLQAMIEFDSEAGPGPE